MAQNQIFTLESKISASKMSGSEVCVYVFIYIYV